MKLTLELLSMIGFGGLVGAGLYFSYLAHYQAKGGNDNYTASIVAACIFWGLAAAALFGRLGE